MSVLRPTAAILVCLFVIALLWASIPSRARLGEIYMNLYLPEKAAVVLRRVLDKDKTDIKAYKTLGEYHLFNGDIESALEVQKELIELRPKNIDYYRKLEWLYGQLGMSYRKLQVMEKRIGHTPPGDEREKLLNELGNGYRWLRKFDDATRVFGRLVTTRKRIYQDNVLNYFLDTRQSDKALELLEDRGYYDDRPEIKARLLLNIHRVFGDKRDRAD